MNNIENAVAIADAYRNSNDGEIPILVIAHALGVQTVFVGTFRKHKNHVHEDQKMFCSVMRMAFATQNITEYEIVVKPEFNYSMQNMTLNILGVMAVNGEEKTIRWFEIEDDRITPHFTDEPMPVEGLFTQLLPTQAERDYEYSPKTMAGINAYLNDCLYIVPEKNVPTEAVSATDAMIAAFS
jgi:hypothetical protein